MARHKYARIERERRFLLDRFPAGARSVRIRRILDRYIEGTALRLRKQSDDGAPDVFKLTQKIPGRAGGSQQGLITSMYLTNDEFSLLAQLPAADLIKTRYSVPPFGIDVFEGGLEGLILAEAEFDSPETIDMIARTFERSGHLVGPHPKKDLGPGLTQGWAFGIWASETSCETRPWPRQPIRRRTRSRAI